MPPIGRTGFSAFMAPNLFRVFVDTGQEAPAEFSRVVNVMAMPYNPVTDQQISGLGTTAVKDEGDTFTFDEPIVGGSKAYTAAAFGLAVEFTWEGWRDELYGVFEEMVRELRRASDNRLEVDAHAPFNNAESTSSPYTGFTSGEALISTSHARLDGGTAIANRPTNDIQLSFTGIQTMLQHFHNLVDERGLPRLMAPSMVLITPEFYHDAREILGSSGKPLTANNEINALVPDDLAWMVSHYLSASTTRWFGLTKQGVHDVNFMVRDRPMFDMFDDPRTKNAVATVYQRHVSGWGTYRGVFGSLGTS